MKEVIRIIYWIHESRLKPEDTYVGNPIVVDTVAVGP